MMMARKPIEGLLPGPLHACLHLPTDGVNYIKLPQLSTKPQVNTCFGDFFKIVPIVRWGETNRADSCLTTFWQHHWPVGPICKVLVSSTRGVAAEVDVGPTCQPLIFSPLRLILNYQVLDSNTPPFFWSTHLTPSNQRVKMLTIFRFIA